MVRSQYALISVHQNWSKDVLIRHKGSSVNVLVTDSTAQFQGTCGVHELTGQSCIGNTSETQTILDRDNIRQMDLMLWLMSI